MHIHTTCPLHLLKSIENLIEQLLTILSYFTCTHFISVNRYVINNHYIELFDRLDTKPFQCDLHIFINQ